MLEASILKKVMGGVLLKIKSGATRSLGAPESGHGLIFNIRLGQFISSVRCD